MSTNDLTWMFQDSPDMPAAPTCAYGGNITLAEVVEIQDKDSQLCKVRVKYKAFANDEVMESNFIRMMSPSAGNEWGWCFIPEIGQQVIVGFINGDTSKACILGCLYDDDKDNPHKAPYAPEGNDKNNQRIIRSRLGNELVFDDTDAKKGVVVLQTGSTNGDKKSPKFEKEGKFTLKLSAVDEKITIADDKKGDDHNELLINSKDGKCEITAAKEITLKAGKNATITLKSSGDVIVEAQNIQFKAKSKITADATSSMELTSKGEAKLQSSANVTVKGAMVKIN